MQTDPLHAHRARVEAACESEARRNAWLVARHTHRDPDCDREFNPAAFPPPTRSTCPAIRPRSTDAPPHIDRTDAGFLVRADDCFRPQSFATRDNENARTFMNWTRSRTGA